MKKALIITVAGLSTRFSRSVGKETLKCVYYEKSVEDSILLRLLNHDASFDRYVIVGGYKFDELKRFADENLSDRKDKIVLINNEKYAEYGSGYSLYLGLDYALKEGFDEIVFAEGDLCVDKETFVFLSDCHCDAVSLNREPIEASKAVIFYLDADKKVHYLYDLSHTFLKIDEPFTAIYNSAQIWKFSDFKRAMEIFDGMKENEWHGTNLVFIQKYFGARDSGSFAFVRFDEWFNCNTVDDFRNSLKKR